MVEEGPHDVQSCDCGYPGHGHRCRPNNRSGKSNSMATTSDRFQPADPTAAGRIRWFGLLVFLAGLSVWAEYDVTHWKDWYVSCGATIVMVVGAIIYFEGLAFRIVELNRRNGSHINDNKQ